MRHCGASGQGAGALLLDTFEHSQYSSHSRSGPRTETVAQASEAADYFEETGLPAAK